MWWLNYVGVFSFSFATSQFSPDIVVANGGLQKDPYLETYFEIVCCIVFSHILFIGPVMILVLINLVSDGSKQEFYMDFSFCKAPSNKLYIMLY